MNPRQAAVLALMGWMLMIQDVGKTVPKTCPDCAVTLQADGYMDSFKTKAGCETAGKKFVQDFYARAQKNGDRVVFPPTTPKCLQQPIKENDSRLKEK